MAGALKGGFVAAVLARLEEDADLKMGTDLACFAAPQ
jgi:hypothetical protein